MPAAPHGVDRFSIDGKFAAPERRADIVVIGAGPAGVAAALAAAAAGAEVALIEETPTPPGMMAHDAPYYFGQRATTAIQNRGRMLEAAFHANPLLETAIEAGVDVMLGVCAWGAYVNGPGLRSLPEPVVGLADADRSFLMGFSSLILAAGARDIALSFPGWDQPGVMGANGMHALLTRYGAFAGRRVCILGSGALGLMTALRAHESGLEVAGVIETRADIQGPDGLAARLAACGIAVFTRCRQLAADRGALGVSGVRFRDVDGGEVALTCDTVVVAVGLSPAIELADVVGARLVLRPGRGGWTPATADGVSLTTPGVFVAGDAAGVTAAALLDEEIARAHGRAAARAALAYRPDPSAAAPQVAGPAFSDPREEANSLEYQLDWTRALLDPGAPDAADIVVCQCEGVRLRDLLALRPPRYLGPRPPAMAARTLEDLADRGSISQDQVKRLTRACMGACQARRCREQIALLLSLAAGGDPAAVPLAGFRAPVRPLPLEVFAAGAEDPAMNENWDVWFGIAAQWIPYDDIDVARERASDGTA